MFDSMTSIQYFVLSTCEPEHSLQVFFYKQQFLQMAKLLMVQVVSYFSLKVEMYL